MKEITSSKIAAIISKYLSSSGDWHGATWEELGEISKCTKEIMNLMEEKT